MSGELSRAQERMWFLERIHPGTAAYNVSSALRLRGPLDAAALEAAWAALVCRHDALRSRFPLVGERPRRVIADRASAVWERIAPPAAADGGAREDLVLAELAHFARRRFDIADGPLVRVALAELAAEDHVVVLVLHHLIADGWSMRILHDELAELYNAHVGAREPALALQAGSYGQYVRAERASTTCAELGQGLAFWRERLAGVQPLALPCDRARPARATFRGGRRIAHLSEESASALEALARSRASSLFFVLQLAFAVLVHRWTGQRDIAIGAPFANRANAETDGIVGLFVNTIVLRDEIDGACSFGELLARRRDSSLEALEHGAVPFEAVVAELRPERSLGDNPLFGVMFALQRAEAQLPRFDGLRATLLDLDLASTRFDLECTTWREPQGLKLRLTYARDLFVERTAELLLQRYVRLLERVASEPDTPVSQLDLVPECERHELLAHRSSLSHPDLDHDVATLVEAQARRTPDAPAIEMAAGGLRYGELAAQARSVAGALRQAGVRRGEIVAVRVAHGAGLASAVLGVMRCGAAPLAMEDGVPPARLDSLLKDAGVRVMLVGDSLDVAGAKKVRRIALRDALESEESKCPARCASPRDAAYAIYTSGTTGRPKGVVVEHRNAVNTLVGCRERFGFDATDRFLCLASPTFDIFYFELLSALVCGASARLADRAELFDPARLASLAREATVMQAVPGLMREIVDALAVHPGAAPRMRHAITGGDTVPPELMSLVADAFPEAQVTILYGPTETAMVCAGVSLREPRAVYGHPLGDPLPNVVLRVYDEHRGLAPVGFAGEIYIGGAGVCRGYLDESPQQAEKFVEIDGERFYRSGDRGCWRSDGSLEFLGRIDDQVKIDGIRVEPAEIEAVMESHADVGQAAVVTCSDRETRRLHAYVVPACSSEGHSSAAQCHISEWRALFEDTHGARTQDAHGRGDFTGWHSSYTGAPLESAQMEDWLASSLAEIEQRLPADRRGSPRVLDVGCGTGLLLFALAPRCERYVATDFAPGLLERVNASIRARGWTSVELHEREAAELLEFQDGRFDVVIVNSVAQYLPGIDYLRAVLDRAVRCVVPGGFVFVGDVRNLALHELFLAGVELHRKPALDRGTLRERVRRRAAQERELLVHPAYFAQLAALPGVARVDVAPRRGRCVSEMQRYRYNVAIYASGGVGDSAGNVPASLQWVDWADASLSLGRVLAEVGRERPAWLALKGIPNALLSDDLAAWRAAAADATAVIPEDLCEGAARIGYEAALSWARGAPDGSFEAILYPRADIGARRPPRWAWLTAAMPGRVANDPLKPSRQREMVARVRASLGERLPAYMIPATIDVLDELPRTANGKLDRATLAARVTDDTSNIRGRTETDSPERSEGQLPTSATERLLARTWSEVLGCGELARTANFFAAGGTSLLAIRVAVRLKSRGVGVSAQDLFRHQTVTELAAAIDERNSTVGFAGIRAGESVGHVAVAGRTDIAAAHSAAATAGTGCARSALRSRPSMPRRSPKRASAAGGALKGAQNVLLTGATGFLGIHLLRELLDDGARCVTCVVRARDDGRAETRLADEWRWHFPGVRVPRGRVTVRAGDITLGGLGLGASAYRVLARDCEHVVHAAADVRHVGDGAEIFRVNVEGTRNVLELVNSGSPMRLHHVSTTGVKGVTGAGEKRRALCERDLDIGQIPTEDYSASKLEAERIVRRSLVENAGGTVMRVGTIAGHSRTGRFQRDAGRNFFVRYLRSTVELGLGCDWRERSFALAPVDTIARAIVLLADCSPHELETFHVSTPHTLTHGQLIGELQKQGYEIRVVGPEEFTEHALERARDPRWESAVGGLLYLIDTPAGNHVRLDARWTLAKLDDAGLRFPRPTSAWLRRFVAGCVETGALPAPPRPGRGGMSEG